MPVYEYACGKCGNEFEVEQRITEEPLKRCIHCRSGVRRLISQTTFILKGGGWYSDGYGSGKGNSGASGTDSGGEKSGADKSSEKSSSSKKDGAKSASGSRSASASSSD